MNIGYPKYTRIGLIFFLYSYHNKTLHNESLYEM